MPLNWAAMAPPIFSQKRLVVSPSHSPGATLPQLNLGLDWQECLSQATGKQHLG